LTWSDQIQNDEVLCKFTPLRESTGGEVAIGIRDDDYLAPPQTDLRSYIDKVFPWSIHI